MLSKGRICSSPCSRGRPEMTSLVQMRGMEVWSSVAASASVHGFPFCKSQSPALVHSLSPRGEAGWKALLDSCHLGLNREGLESDRPAVVSCSKRKPWCFLLNTAVFGLASWSLLLSHHDVCFLLHRRTLILSRVHLWPAQT